MSMNTLAQTEPGILNEWAIALLSVRDRRDLCVLIKDRIGSQANLMTSRRSSNDWHDVTGDHTFYNASLNRLVYYPHRLTGTGGATRCLRPPEYPTHYPPAFAFLPEDRHQPKRLTTMDGTWWSFSAKSLTEFGEARISRKVRGSSSDLPLGSHFRRLFMGR